MKQSIATERAVIKVVAGVLIRNNHVLITSRPPDKSHPGYWEFPGGKLDFGETAVVALVRELKEEIGVLANADDCEYLSFIVQDYPTARVELDVIKVTKWQGEVLPMEGQDIIWHNLAMLCEIEPLLPTTKQILNLLY